MHAGAPAPCVYPRPLPVRQAEIFAEVAEEFEARFPTGGAAADKAPAKINPLKDFLELAAANAPEGAPVKTSARLPADKSFADFASDYLDGENETKGPPPMRSALPDSEAK